MPRHRTKIIQPNIMNEIFKAIDTGLFVFVLIVGKKGFGKSTLALTLMKEIYHRKVGLKRAWQETLNHLVFTPQQFYQLYADVKNSVDDQVEELGIDPSILRLDPNNDWPAIVAMVSKLVGPVNDFSTVLAKYRIQGLLVDDFGAHMNRQNQAIYYNEFYQQLFGDLTLIRPYIGALIATAPAIEDIPRSVLKHVTDVIDCRARGSAVYKKKLNLVRFQGSSLQGYMKLYSGDPIKWDQLDAVIYGRYEFLRHLLSRQVTIRGIRAAAELLQK